MNTKVLMTASAIILAAAGVILTFIPEEILTYNNLEATKPLQFIIQILGALYFAFGMLNWMTKTSLIGGIYNRPIAVANFAHFFIAGLALIKGLISDSGMPYFIWIVTSFYLILAVAFGFILFWHPLSKNNPQD